MEKIKILLIDDDKVAVREIEQKLDNSEFILIAADSQKEAEEFIRTQDIRLCLIEQFLKNDDGIKICRELKDIDSLLKIILINNDPGYENAVEAMRNGAFDYISKKLESDQLKKRIKIALNLQGSEILQKKKFEGHGIVLICHHSMVREGFENFSKTYPEYTLLYNIHSVDFLKKKDFNLNTSLVLICQTCNKKCDKEPENFYPALGPLFPKAKIIMMNSYADEKQKKELIKFGIRGFLPKNIFKANMEKAFRAVLRGQVWASRRVTDSLLNEYLKFENTKYIPIGSPLKLTKREMSVLRMIPGGLTNAEISEQLLISEKTVKAHLSSIFRKLDVRSRSQAVKKAFEEHII